VPFLLPKDRTSTPRQPLTKALDHVPKPRTTAALGLALLSVAAPAAAQAQAPAHVPVPAGQLQHTVTDLTFPAAKNTFHHDALRNERWIGASAGRELVTNLSTGKVREDCQHTLTVVRCWAAPLNAREPAAGTTHILPGDPVLLESWDDVGAGVKALVGQSRGYTSLATRRSSDAPR
jgi:hypothetical protein